MTDHHAGYIVVLETDIREDDAADVINALKMVRGVASVEPVVHSSEIAIAETRVRAVMKHKVFEVLTSL